MSYGTRWKTGNSMTTSRLYGVWCALALVLLCGYPVAATAEEPFTERVSVDSSGNQANNSSYYPAISADGRYVAFRSDASNLVAGDTNASSDIFVHDSVTGETTRVSVDSSGNEGNGDSYWPAISADGRYIAFGSLASNLVPGDTNGARDIFLHDALTGETTRLSVDASGNQANGSSYWAAISGDGGYVAFHSLASNLVPGDTNGVEDVLLHDTLTGATTRVSVDSSGNQGNGGSHWSAISGDGRYVVFYTYASNLVPGDTNVARDAFLHDTLTGTTTRVSVDSTGNQANGWSGVTGPATISADGRYVAFDSYASNLVAGDTNASWDIFVHDSVTGTTTRVSVDSSGTEGNLGSNWPGISANGRYVAFASSASNLIPGDTNRAPDVFLHDTLTGATTRVTVGSSGDQANASSGYPAISADGWYVAFVSMAYNLVPGDTNGMGDIFVRGPLGPTPILVAIDIKPGSEPNSINLGAEGVVPVAILTTLDFDAVMVDEFSLALSGSAVRLKGKSGNAGSLEDVDGDGYLDLVVHFYIDMLDLEEGATEAVLEGFTLDGIPIIGFDWINVVP